MGWKSALFIFLGGMAFMGLISNIALAINLTGIVEPHFFVQHTWVRQHNLADWINEDINAENINWSSMDLNFARTVVPIKRRDDGNLFSYWHETGKTMEELGWHRAADGCNWEICDKWHCYITLMLCERRSVPQP